MRKFFAQFGIRPWAVVAIFLGGIFILLWCELWSKPWITPLPGVVMEPARPVLKRTDVPRGSAFDFLWQASTGTQSVGLSPESGESQHLWEESAKWNLKPWSDAAFPDSVTWLNKNRAVIDLAGKAASASDHRIPTLVSPLDRSFHVYQLIQISKLLEASAARKVSQGDFDGASADLNECLDLADILSRGGGVAYRAMEIAIELRTLTAMRDIALLNNVPVGIAIKTISHLDTVDKAVEPFVETYREESRQIPGWIDAAFQAGDNRLQLPPFFIWIRRTQGFTNNTPAVVKQDMESVFAHFALDAEKPYDRNSQKQLEDIFHAADNRSKSSILLMTRDLFGYALMRNFYRTLPFLTVRHYARIAALRSTEVVFAIRQFEKDERHPPERLEDLVPKYLSSVPIDPFDGKPLRYITGADGSWRVYSVGPNQLDEGGLIALPIPQYHDMVSLPDLGVYGTPGDFVYPDSEAADAKKKIEDEESKEKLIKK